MRALDAPFVPHANRATFVEYSVAVDLESTIATSPQHGSIRLQLAPPAGALADHSRMGHSISLGGPLLGQLGNLVTDSRVEGTLSAIVPAGWTVQLTTSVESGTPNFSFLEGNETPL